MDTIAVIVGSLRKDSFNRKIAFAMDKLDHPGFQFSVIKIDDIPLYNQDLDNHLPDSVIRFKKEMSNAKAILFVTPEYNRSIPGVLKNLIDWGSRPFGQSIWPQKIISIIGTSPGAVGTAVAQSHLRSIMSSLGSIVFCRPEVYLVYKDGLVDDQFQITVEGTKKFLQDFLNQFIQTIHNISAT